MNESPEVPEPVTTLHVRRAIGGDLGSLNWLVVRLSPLLIAQAEYRLGPRLRVQVDPEDLVNEAWAVALPRLEELGHGSDRLTPVLLKFLSTTMNYRINNMLRSRAAASRACDSERLDQLSGPTSGVITKAVRNETRTLVREQLDQLDSIDLEVIMLRGIEQNPANAVAVMLGITPMAVDKRYSRALQRLRSRLEDSVFDELVD